MVNVTGFPDARMKVVFIIFYYKIYRERMDEQVILRDVRYIKTRHLYYIIKNYIWRA